MQRCGLMFKQTIEQIIPLFLSSVKFLNLKEIDSYLFDTRHAFGSKAKIHTQDDSREVVERLSLVVVLTEVV